MSGERDGGHSAGRLMIFDLDSINQRERWSSGFIPVAGLADDPSLASRRAPRLSPVGVISAAGLQWFAGVVRTADLLCETVVVTDSQLLDGVFFQALGVDRVLALMGRDDLHRPPITVLGRGVSLEESLRSIAGDPDERPFEYQTLHAVGVTAVDIAARAHPDAVRRARPGEVAAAVGTMLGEVTGSSIGRAYCDELGRAWQGWIDAECLGLIQYERYREPQPARFSTVFDEWRPTALPMTADDDLVAKVAATASRSVALDVLRQAVAEGQLSGPDRGVIEAWYERAYADYIATNNEADWIDVVGGRFNHLPARRAISEGVRTTSLRGTAPLILGRMPSSRYAIFVWANRTLLATFRGDRSQDDTDAVAYSVQRADAEVDLRDERRSLVIGLAASLGVTALVFVLGAVSDVPRVAWLVPMIVLLVTLAGQVFAEREPIRAVRHSALQSTLYLREGPK